MRKLLIVTLIALIVIAACSRNGDTSDTTEAHLRIPNLPTTENDTSPTNVTSTPENNVIVDGDINDYTAEDFIGEFEYSRPFPEIPGFTEGVNLELMSEGSFVLRVWRGTEAGLMKGTFDIADSHLAFAVTHVSDAHAGGWEEIDTYLDDMDLPVEDRERQYSEIITTLNREYSYIRFININSLVYRHVTEGGFELFSGGELILTRQSATR
jgi:hypothetical protein